VTFYPTSGILLGMGVLLVFVAVLLVLHWPRVLLWLAVIYFLLLAKQNHARRRPNFP